MKLEGQTTFREELARKMKDPAFKAAFEAPDPEYDIYDALMEARIKGNLTQKQLAEKIGIKQSALARIESGGISSTFETIQKLLRALGYTLKVVKM